MADEHYEIDEQRLEALLDAEIRLAELAMLAARPSAHAKLSDHDDG